MVQRIILQSIDSPRRDTEWRILMAKKLSDAGFHSIIGSKRKIYDIHKSSKNCIFLGRLNSNTGRSQRDFKYLDKMSENNTRVIFIHDEGGIYLKKSYERSVNQIYPKDHLKRKEFKRMLFWGEEQAKFFKNEPFQEKLKTVGAPRFDLLKEEYKDIDQKNTSKLKSEFQDYILLCGRFAIANIVEDDPNPLGKRMVDILCAEEESSKDREDIMESLLKNWSKTNLEFSLFVLAISKLSKKFPKTNFVIRPHPGEKQSFYEDTFSGYSNIHVTKQGDARPFIRAAKAVVHSECTTGLEAEICGIPTINFRPATAFTVYEGFEVAGVSDSGETAHTIEDLIHAINSIEKKTAKKEAKTDKEKYIKNIPEEVNSTNLILEEIKSVSSEIQEDSSIKKYKNSGNILKKFLKNLQSKNSELSGDSKKAFYDKETIEELWTQLGGARKDIKVEGDTIFTSPGS